MFTLGLKAPFGGKVKILNSTLYVGNLQLSVKILSEICGVIRKLQLLLCLCFQPTAPLVLDQFGKWNCMVLAIVLLNGAVLSF